MSEHNPAVPTCPSCGRPMHAVRSVPGIGGLPELRVYSCRPCGVSMTEPAEHFERIHSHATPMS